MFSSVAWTHIGKFTSRGQAGVWDRRRDKVGNLETAGPFQDPEIVRSGVGESADPRIWVRLGFG